VSGTQTERADDPADFGTSPRGIAARWIAELRLAEQDSHKFLDRGRKVYRRYMDERETADKDETKFNVLWSNIQTLKPAVYATPPKPVVQRRYLDQDPTGRAASTILQRAIATNIEHTGWHEATELAVMDYLLPGRGTCWARYEPHFDSVQADQVQAQALQNVSPDADNVSEGPADDGVQVTNNAEGEILGIEEVQWDYVNWQDFLHSPARVWSEVRWVARRTYYTREDGIERFGAMFRDVPLNRKPQGLEETDPVYELFCQAEVYEIWDKPSRKVIWLCPDYGDAPLDVLGDPLGLNDFYPCPRPLYATLSNSSLMPAPDFKMYQDQAREMDDLTARMAALVRAIKVVGVYDASNDGVQRIFNEGVENQLIPIDNMMSFAQAGGFKGAVDFLPLEPMVIALRELIMARTQTKQDLYEITGIADIVRGQGAATATATAERLKGQFAQLRLRDRVNAVARFCRDMVRITGEIIARKFQPQTLLLLSDYQQTAGATPETAMQAIALLKNDLTRGFRIEIEVDSTVVADQEQEQASRVQFLQMAGQFLAEAVPLAQQVPQLGMLAGQMLLFGIRGFPVGREMETVFETALEQLQQASQAPQPEAPPDPAIVKAQADAQTAAAEIQSRERIEAAKLQAEAARADREAALKEAQLALDQAKLDLDMRRAELEEARHETERQRGDVDKALRERDMGLKERQQKVEEGEGEISAIAEALAMMQETLDAVRTKAEEAHAVASAPRRVTIERGPDGRAIGARQELEAV